MVSRLGKIFEFYCFRCLPLKQHFSKLNGNISNYFNYFQNVQHWEHVSKLFTYQSWKACRNKWLSQKQAKVGWTPDEDKALIELYYQHPNKWCEIAIELMKKCKTFYAR